MLRFSWATRCRWKGRAGIWDVQAITVRDGLGRLKVIKWRYANIVRFRPHFSRPSARICSNWRHWANEAGGVVHWRDNRNRTVTLIPWHWAFAMARFCTPLESQKTWRPPLTDRTDRACWFGMLRSKARHDGRCGWEGPASTIGQRLKPTDRKPGISGTWKISRCENRGMVCE